MYNCSLVPIKPKLHILSEQFSKSPPPDNICGVVVAVTGDGMCSAFSNLVLFMFQPFVYSYFEMPLVKDGHVDVMGLVVFPILMRDKD